MSPQSSIQRTLLAAAAVVVAALAAAGCGPAETPLAAAPTGEASPVTTVAPDPAEQPAPLSGVDPEGGPDPAAPPTRKPSTGNGWPSPEDCVAYDPGRLTVQFDNGIYTVGDGTTVVARVHGQDGDGVGDKVLALAQRYRKHCYIGRSNTRVEERGSYIFDYWRGSSGQTPPIPGQDEDCSSYDRGNLTVDDMGNGYGWRVKDHDHVLHLFDNESDARDGALVLARTNQLCFIGDNDGGQDVISYRP
jgi:hypothetical protein